MSYGYNSSTAFSKTVTGISDEAAMFLDRLNGERQIKDQKTRPIIIVSHSLGGIIVKKASQMMLIMKIRY
jgi:predicted alpha/beta hydrolase family esterase